MPKRYAKYGFFFLFPRDNWQIIEKQTWGNTIERLRQTARTYTLLVTEGEQTVYYKRYKKLNNYCDNFLFKTITCS